MRTPFSGIITLAASVVLIAAAPAPKPVITIDGVTTAVKLDAAARTAMATQVAGLNAGLLKVVALHKSYAGASATERAKIQRDIADVHEQCLAIHNAIIKLLDPEQRAAFYKYLHERMKAAGIDASRFDHGGMMSDTTHGHRAMHGAMSGHGG